MEGKVIRVVTDYEYKQVNGTIELVPIFEEIPEEEAFTYEEVNPAEEIAVRIGVDETFVLSSLVAVAFVGGLIVGPFILEWVSVQVETMALAGERLFWSAVRLMSVLCLGLLPPALLVYVIYWHLNRVRPNVGPTDRPTDRPRAEENNVIYNIQINRYER